MRHEAGLDGPLALVYSCSYGCSCYLAIFYFLFFAVSSPLDDLSQVPFDMAILTEMWL